MLVARLSGMRKYVTTNQVYTKDVLNWTILLSALHIEFHTSESAGKVRIS